VCVTNLDKLAKKPPSAVKFMLWMTALVHLIANMFGLPLVKFSYIIYVFLLFILINSKDIKDSLFPFIIFSLFEGQGRVLWGYAPWARIIFDVLLAFMVLKRAIKSKKLWNWDFLPNILNVLFILHFVWFFIELFNPLGASLMASFATSKFYIFPILLFFFFLDLPLSSRDIFLQRNILALIFVMLSLSLVIIIQDSGSELFMEQMNSNYINLFEKYKVFTDYAFRPWGTSFAPGGMGTLLFGSVGLILLFNPRVLAEPSAYRVVLFLLKYICLLLMFYCLFVGEVRSATIKFVGIILFVELWNFFRSGKKFKKVMGSIFILSIITFLSTTSNKMEYLSDYDYENEIGRWTKLEKEGVGGQRSSFWKIADAVQKKVNFPLGFGLGMTTSFLPAFEAKRRQIIQTPRHYYWNMDNLFMFLMLELGIGAIFYGGAILFVFLSSISQFFYGLRFFPKEEFKEISIATATVLFIFIGNWGAVGIPYNPESFFFWFWVAILFKTTKKVKDSGLIQLSQENNSIK